MGLFEVPAILIIVFGFVVSQFAVDKATRMLQRKLTTGSAKTRLFKIDSLLSTLAPHKAFL